MCIFSHYRKEVFLLNVHLQAIEHLYLGCPRRLGIASAKSQNICPGVSVRKLCSLDSHLMWHSRWKCSHLGLAPSVLQMYNPLRRSLLEHIFSKAKQTSHPFKQDIHVFQQEQTLLFARGGINSSNMLQEKLHSTPQAVHWHYESKLIQAHWGDRPFLSSKYHCPLNQTLKVIALRLKPKQSRLFCALKSSLKLCLDCTGKVCIDVTVKAKKICSPLPVQNKSS